MTEEQVRQKIVSVMQGWIGCKESDGSHRKIIDAYNSHRPLPRGYAVKYTDAWCATTTSAAAVKAGYTDIVPLECSCYYIVENAKKMGIWKENDGYTPKPGDLIIYDWEDSTGSSRDNTGAPDHIGMVESVSGGSFVVIEGNKSNAVGRRTMAINGRYIRGFICPNYASKATSSGSGADTGSNTKKTTEQIAKEVIAGKWGNGVDRKAKLTAAGYDYAAIQAKVNELLGGKKTSSGSGAGDKQTTYAAGDKVRVTGTIYGNGNGTGGSLKKKGEVMYVTGLVDSKKYNYYIGVAAKKGGARQGWAKPSQLTKC